MRDYTNQIDIIRSHDAEIALEIEPLRNLEAVLKWAPDLTGIDSVQQDEYNYDIVLRWKDHRWLSFGCS